MSGDVRRRLALLRSFGPSRLGRAAIAALVATCAYLVALVSAPAAWRWLDGAWIVTLGVVAVWGAVGLVGDALSPAQNGSFEPAGPEFAGGFAVQLTAIERSIRLCSADPAEARFRLRPIVVRIARARLAERRQIDLDSDPEAARAALGEDAWDLLTPADPHERPRRPLPAATIRNAIEALERL